MKLRMIADRRQVEEGWGKNLATAGMIGLGALGAGSRAQATDPPQSGQSAGAVELRPGDPRKPTVQKQGSLVTISFLASKLPGADEKLYNSYSELAKKKLGVQGYAHKQSRTKQGNRIVYVVKFGGVASKDVKTNRDVKSNSTTAADAGDFLD